MSTRVIDRRGFIKSTLTGFGGFVFLASSDKKQGELVTEKRPEERKFLYRTLGKTRMKLPVISMGVMNSDNPNLVRAALDAGIVHLDTARSYQRGQNERMIGEVLKGRPRDSYVIATKAKLPRNFVYRLIRGTFLEQLDISLKSLGLEYVDILYNHDIGGREAALSEPVLNAMDIVKKVGKARFVGVSTHRNEPEVIQAAIDSELYDLVLTSYNFRQNHYRQVREAIAKAAQAGLGIVAMKTMAGTNAENPRAALKWVLRDPNVHTIISGFTTFDQMNLDLSVMESPTLTDSEKKDLQMKASLPGIYCQGCGQCLKQCPAKLPIPELMRAYMYAYGYRQPALAQNLIASLDLPRHVCEDCSSCPVLCLNRWNVAEKIRDIARLRNVPSEFFV
jgi:predicted aldo/keto reductase-like oxidoreductase